MRTQYYVAASLDGYIADPDDGIDWLTGYEGSYEGAGAEPDAMGSGGSYEDFYERVGALVSGSATYEWILDHLGEEACSTTSSSPWSRSRSAPASRCLSGRCRRCSSRA